MRKTISLLIIVNILFNGSAPSYALRPMSIAVSPTTVEGMGKSSSAGSVGPISPKINSNPDVKTRPSKFKIPIAPLGSLLTGLKRKLARLAITEKTEDLSAFTPPPLDELRKIYGREDPFKIRTKSELLAVLQGLKENPSIKAGLDKKIQYYSFEHNEFRDRIRNLYHKYLDLYRKKEPKARTMSLYALNLIGEIVEIHPPQKSFSLRYAKKANLSIEEFFALLDIYLEVDTDLVIKSLPEELSLLKRPLPSEVSFGDKMFRQVREKRRLQEQLSWQDKKMPLISIEANLRVYVEDKYVDEIIRAINKAGYGEQEKKRYLSLILAEEREEVLEVRKQWSWNKKYKSAPKYLIPLVESLKGERLEEALDLYYTIYVAGNRDPGAFDLLVELPSLYHSLDEATYNLAISESYRLTQLGINPVDFLKHFLPQVVGHFKDQELNRIINLYEDTVLTFYKYRDLSPSDPEECIRIFAIKKDDQGKNIYHKETHSYEYDYLPDLVENEDFIYSLELALGAAGLFGQGRFLLEALTGIAARFGRARYREMAEWLYGLVLKEENAFLRKNVSTFITDVILGLSYKLGLDNFKFKITRILDLFNKMEEKGMDTCLAYMSFKDDYCRIYKDDQRFKLLMSLAEDLVENGINPGPFLSQGVDRYTDRVDQKDEESLIKLLYEIAKKIDPSKTYLDGTWRESRSSLDALIFSVGIPAIAGQPGEKTRPDDTFGLDKKVYYGEDFLDEDFLDAVRTLKESVALLNSLQDEGQPLYMVKDILPNCHRCFRGGNRNLAIRFAQQMYLLDYEPAPFFAYLNPKIAKCLEENKLMGLFSEIIEMYESSGLEISPTLLDIFKSRNQPLLLWIVYSIIYDAEKALPTLVRFLREMDAEEEIRYAKEKNMATFIITLGVLKLMGFQQLLVDQQDLLPGDIISLAFYAAWIVVDKLLVEEEKKAPQWMADYLKTSEFDVLGLEQAEEKDAREGIEPEELIGDEQLRDNIRQAILTKMITPTLQHIRNCKMLPALSGKIYLDNVSYFDIFYIIKPFSRMIGIRIMDKGYIDVPHLILPATSTYLTQTYLIYSMVKAGLFFNDFCEFQIGIDGKRLGDEAKYISLSQLITSARQYNWDISSDQTLIGGIPPITYDGNAQPARTYFLEDFIQTAPYWRAGTGKVVDLEKFIQYLGNRIMQKQLLSYALISSKNGNEKYIKIWDRFKQGMNNILAEYKLQQDLIEPTWIRLDPKEKYGFGYGDWNRIKQGLEGLEKIKWAEAPLVKVVHDTKQLLGEVIEGIADNIESENSDAVIQHRIKEEQAIYTAITTSS